MSAVKNLLRGLLDLFYPRVCPICGEALMDIPSEQCVCLACYAELRRPHSTKSAQVILEERLRDKLIFQHAVAAYYFEKKTGVQTLIHQLKYNGREDIGEMLGRDLGKTLQESGLFGDVDCIVPVPLHKKKQRKRGYNQCDAIARGITAVTGWPIENTALKRTVHNASQTTMDGETRWQNVQGIFTLDRPELLKGKNVLLVDDVITTGATVTSCAEEIKKAGGVKIYIASACCTNQ